MHVLTQRWIWLPRALLRESLHLGRARGRCGVRLWSQPSEPPLCARAMSACSASLAIFSISASESPSW